MQRVIWAQVRGRLEWSRLSGRVRVGRAPGVGGWSVPGARGARWSVTVDVSDPVVILPRPGSAVFLGGERVRGDRSIWTEGVPLSLGRDGVPLVWRSSECSDVEDRTLITVPAEPTLAWSRFLPGLAMWFMALLVPLLAPIRLQPSLLASAERLPDPDRLRAAYRTGLDRGTLDSRVLGALQERLERLRADTALRASIERHRGRYLSLVDTLRARGLPAVLAAVPWIESRYRPSATSACCAAGPWQLMPEFGSRYPALPAGLQGCRLEGGAELQIGGKTPPRNACSRADYVRDGACLLRCDVDQRRDWGWSTAVALEEFAETWHAIGPSDDRVELLLFSHHAGFDDARWGVPKRSNMRPVQAAWRSVGGQDGRFHGDALSCPGASCPPGFPLESRHYALAVMAHHIFAMCVLRPGSAEQEVLCRDAE